MEDLLKELLDEVENSMNLVNKLITNKYRLMNLTWKLRKYISSPEEKKLIEDITSHLKEVDIQNII
jgi:hypothetical protein